MTLSVIICKMWKPVLDKFGVKLPLQCPLHFGRDVFFGQESAKVPPARAATPWTCRTCGKAFHGEPYLDLHIARRHPELLRHVRTKSCPAPPRRWHYGFRVSITDLQGHADDDEAEVCLSDYCDLFRCQGFLDNFGRRSSVRRGDDNGMHGSTATFKLSAEFVKSHLFLGPAPDKAAAGRDGGGAAGSGEPPGAQGPDVDDGGGGGDVLQVARTGGHVASKELALAPSGKPLRDLEDRPGAPVVGEADPEVPDVLRDPFGLGGVQNVQTSVAHQQGEVAVAADGSGGKKLWPEDGFLAAVEHLIKLTFPDEGRRGLAKGGGLEATGPGVPGGAQVTPDEEGDGGGPGGAPCDPLAMDKVRRKCLVNKWLLMLSTGHES